VLGGLPFASFGTARPLWLAVAGAAVAVLAIVIAIGAVANVLEAQECTPAALGRDSRLEKRVASDRTLTAGQTSELRKFITSYQESERAAYKTSRSEQSHLEGTPERAKALLAMQRRDELALVYSQLADLSLFDEVAHRFKIAKYVAMGAAIVVAMGGGCFAYATSRPAPSPARR